MEYNEKKGNVGTIIFIIIILILLAVSGLLFYNYYNLNKNYDDIDKKYTDLSKKYETMDTAYKDIEKSYSECNTSLNTCKEENKNDTSDSKETTKVESNIKYYYSKFEGINGACYDIVELNEMTNEFYQTYSSGCEGWSSSYGTYNISGTSLTLQVKAMLSGQDGDYCNKNFGYTWKYTISSSSIIDSSKEVYKLTTDKNIIKEIAKMRNNNYADAMIYTNNCDHDNE